MQRAGDIKEVEQAFAKFISAFNAMDLLRLGECFAPQVTLFAPAASSLLSGASSVSSHFGRVFESEPESGPSVQPVNIQINRLSPEAALVTFEFGRPLESVGRRTIVFHRAQDQWLVAHIHASNTPPRRDA